MVEVNSAKLADFQVKHLNKDEFHTIRREIWVDEIYKSVLLSNNPIMVDVGAHVGIATLYFKKNYPKAKILSFEPNPYLFELLKENVNANGLSDIKLYNYALAVKPGLRDFYIDSSENKWYSTGNFEPKAWNKRQDTQKIQVQTQNLEYIFMEVKNWSQRDQIDLLKLDIEGAESSILKNNAELLSRIRSIIIEYHPTPTNKERNIVKALTKSGHHVDVEEKEEGLKIFKAHK